MLVQLSYVFFHIYILKIKVYKTLTQGSKTKGPNSEIQNFLFNIVLQPVEIRRAIVNQINQVGKILEQNLEIKIQESILY